MWELRALICGLFLLSAPKRSYLPFATKINVLIDIRAYYNNEFPLHFDTTRKNVSSRGCHLLSAIYRSFPPFLSCFPGLFFSLPAVGLEMTYEKKKLIDCNSIFQILFISMFIVVYETMIRRVTFFIYCFSFYTRIGCVFFFLLDLSSPC